MRRNIVAANWKSNLNFEEAKCLIEDLNSFNNHSFNCELVISPPYLYLNYLIGKIKSNFKIAAQNVSQWSYGAFTGEISAEMLASIRTNYCIIGHSERRKYFDETNDVIEKKLFNLLNNDITPIYCCGETIDDRKNNKHFKLVESQIQESLFVLSASDIQKVIIAYEPVWAIGTGETASPNQAEEMHSFIRKLIIDKYDEAIANRISIIYGGSVKPSNAKEIFEKPNVDGGLIGGASLNASDFINIAKSI